MAEDDFTVSSAMWAALGVVITRAQGIQATHVVRSPVEGSDSAIARRQALALADRSFIQLSDDGRSCYPLEGGRRAFAHHQRMEARRDGVQDHEP